MPLMNDQKLATSYVDVDPIVHVARLLIYTALSS